MMVAKDLLSMFITCGCFALIQTLGTRNVGLVQSQLDRIIISCTSQDRREKLSRYKNKKSRRNFGRKIKVKTRKMLKV